MHLDPALPYIVGSLLVILLMGLLLHRLKQPHVVGYLIVGILLGPNVLNMINDQATIERIGAMGVVFLLFFIGMEASPRRLMATWRITVIGTIIQILISERNPQKQNCVGREDRSQEIRVGFLSMDPIPIVFDSEDHGILGFSVSIAVDLENGTDGIRLVVPHPNALLAKDAHIKIGSQFLSVERSVEVGRDDRLERDVSQFPYSVRILTDSL